MSSESLRTDEELVTLVKESFENHGEGWVNFSFTVNDIKNPNPRTIQDVYAFLVKQISHNSVDSAKFKAIATQMEAPHDLPLLYLFRTMRDLLIDLNYFKPFSINYLTKPTPSSIREMLALLTNAELVMASVWGENEEAENRAIELGEKYFQLAAEKDDLKSKIDKAVKEEMEAKLCEEQYLQNIASLRPRIDKLYEAEAQLKGVIEGKKSTLGERSKDLEKAKRALEDVVKEERQVESCVVKDPEQLEIQKADLTKKLEELNQAIQKESQDKPGHDMFLSKLNEKISNLELVTVKLDDCKSVLQKQKTLAEQLAAKRANYQRLQTEEGMMNTAKAAAEQKVAYLEREMAQFKASCAEKFKSKRQLEEGRKRLMQDLENKVFDEDAAKRHIVEQEKKLRERQATAEQLLEQLAVMEKEIEVVWSQKIRDCQEAISQHLNEIFGAMDRDVEVLEDITKSFR